LEAVSYERSTQECLAIKQDLAEPDPTRLAYRDVIRQVIHEVVTHAEEGSLRVVQRKVIELVADADRENVQALILEELRRLHEGSLSR